MQFHPNDLTLLTILQPVACAPSHLVLEHLSRCHRCQLRLKGLQRARVTTPDPPYSEQSSYEAVFDRTQSRLQSHLHSWLGERSKADRLLEEEKEKSYDERMRNVRRQRQLQTWSVVETLISAGRKEGLRNLPEANNLLLLALEASNHLRASHYGQERLEDLKARSWAVIGNIRRLESDLMSAKEAFSKSKFHLKRGTADPLEHADILDLESSLLRNQDQVDEAENAIRRAMTIFRKAGEKHRLGRGIIKLSAILSDKKEFDQSLHWLQQAAPLLDYEREPRLFLCIRHNMANNLVGMGHPIQAQAILLGLRPVYNKFPDHSIQIFRQWTEAHIAYSLGRLHEAEALLSSVKEKFLARGMAVNATHVSNEMAWAKLLDQKRSIH